MKTSLITCFLVAAALPVFAEPEIKGTAAELSHFLTEAPKTVTVSGVAKIRVPAHRAILSLRIVTESKSLQDAMRSNVDIRGKVAEFLRGQGIAAERIEGSKFSSTPKFGIFSEKAKSYRLENVMRVSIQDDKEFQSAASAVDKWSEVQFDGVEFEYADKEQQRQNAIAKACDNANERKKIYEEKLGIKLVAQGFGEGSVNSYNATPKNYAGISAGYTVARADAGASSFGPQELTGAPTSFGEMVYTASVTVQYAVQFK